MTKKTRTCRCENDWTGYFSSTFVQVCICVFINVNTKSQHIITRFLNSEPKSETEFQSTNFRPIVFYIYTHRPQCTCVPSTREVRRVTLAAFRRPAGKFMPILSSFSRSDRPPFLDFALGRRGFHHDHK